MAFLPFSFKFIRHSHNANVVFSKFFCWLISAILQFPAILENLHYKTFIYFLFLNIILRFSKGHSEALSITPPEYSNLQHMIFLRSHSYRLWPGLTSVIPQELVFPRVMAVSLIAHTFQPRYSQHPLVEAHFFCLGSQIYPFLDFPVSVV